MDVWGVFLASRDARVSRGEIPYHSNLLNLGLRLGTF